MHLGQQRGAGGQHRFRLPVPAPGRTGGRSRAGRRTHRACRARRPRPAGCAGRRAGRAEVRKRIESWWRSHGTGAAARAAPGKERNGQAQARLACDLTGRRPLAGRAAPAGRAPHDLAQAGAGHSRADGVMPCGNVDKTSTIGIFPAPNVRPHAGRHARARLPFPIPRSTRMNLPARVVDLHTHLFNARYLPLESVIASAMKKDESTLRTTSRSCCTHWPVPRMRTPRICARPSAAVHARGRGRALSGADLGRRPRRPDGAGARRHDRRAQPGGPA